MKNKTNMTKYVGLYLDILLDFNTCQDDLIITLLFLTKKNLGKHL